MHQTCTIWIKATKITFSVQHAHARRAKGGGVATDIVRRHRIANGMVLVAH